MDFNYIMKKLGAIYGIAFFLVLAGWIMKPVVITTEKMLGAMIFLFIVFPIVAVSWPTGIDKRAITVEGGKAFLYFLGACGLTGFSILLFAFGTKYL